MPKPCEADGRAELPGFAVLSKSDFERRLEIRLGFDGAVWRECQQQLAVLAV